MIPNSDTPSKQFKLRQQISLQAIPGSQIDGKSKSQLQQPLHPSSHLPTLHKSLFALLSPPSQNQALVISQLNKSSKNSNSTNLLKKVPSEKNTGILLNRSAFGNASATLSKVPSVKAFTNQQQTKQNIEKGDRTQQYGSMNNSRSNNSNQHNNSMNLSNNNNNNNSTIIISNSTGKGKLEDFNLPAITRPAGISIDTSILQDQSSSFSNSINPLHSYSSSQIILLPKILLDPINQSNKLSQQQPYQQQARSPMKNQNVNLSKDTASPMKEKSQFSLNLFPHLLRNPKRNEREIHEDQQLFEELLIQSPHPPAHSYITQSTFEEQQEDEEQGQREEEKRKKYHNKRSISLAQKKLKEFKSSQNQEEKNTAEENHVEESESDKTKYLYVQKRSKLRQKWISFSENTEKHRLLDLSIRKEAASIVAADNLKHNSFQAIPHHCFLEAASTADEKERERLVCGNHPVTQINELTKQLNQSVLDEPGKKRTLELSSYTAGSPKSFQPSSFFTRNHVNSSNKSAIQNLIEAQRSDLKNISNKSRSMQMQQDDDDHNSDQSDY